MKVIPKYQEGKRIIGGYNRKGNMVLPVTNDKGINNVTLPETTITPKNNMNLAAHIDKGKRNFLQTSKELITPVVIGAGIAGLGAGLATSPFLTLGSTASGIGGSYVGGKIGENIDKRTNNSSDYKQLGELVGGTMVGTGTALIPKVIARDAYTTVGGKFGYYGNPVQRIWHTLGRNRNWNVNAKHPELLRKLEKPITVNSNGTLQVTNPNPRFTETITNFTTDRPVVAHSQTNNWDHMDLMILNPRITKGMKPRAIEPSDTFYTNNITAKPSQTTLVSGNKAALINAKDKGMSTLSSPELRRLYSEMNAKYLGKLTEYSKMTPAKRRLQKEGFRDIVDNELKGRYANEQRRLQSKRGTPTVEDYAKLEKQTGLNAGVVSIKKLNPELVNKIIESRGNFTYPNGEWLDSSDYGPNYFSGASVLNRTPYNKVFYDPASTVEYDFRDALNIKLK